MDDSLGAAEGEAEELGGELGVGAVAGGAGAPVALAEEVAHAIEEDVGHLGIVLPAVRLLDDGIEAGSVGSGGRAEQPHRGEAFRFSGGDPAGVEDGAGGGDGAEEGIVRIGVRLHGVDCLVEEEHQAGEKVAVQPRRDDGHVDAGPAEFGAGDEVDALDAAAGAVPAGGGRP